jgi:hypothetical protein
MVEGYRSHIARKATMEAAEFAGQTQGEGTWHG